MNSFYQILAVTLLGGLLGWLPVVCRAQTPNWSLAVGAQHGVNGSSQVYESAADAAGNVYLTGFFTGTVTFGPSTLVSVGGEDVFVARWSAANQTFDWAWRAGGSSDERPYGIAVSSSGVYVAGYFISPTATFGSVALANSGPYPSCDVFVVKLTNAGSFGWAQQLGGLGNESCGPIAATSGAVYVGGGFTGPALVAGSQQLPNTTSDGQNDGYVAKFSDAGTSGSLTWIQQLSGFGSEYVLALAASNAKVYAVGNFASSMTLGGSLLLTGGNTFVTKLLDAGPSSSFVWAQAGNCTSYSEATMVAVSGDNVYIGGDFMSTITLGNTILTVPSSAGNDSFVAKLTDAGSTGAFVWARQASPSPTQVSINNRVWGLKTSNGVVYVAGTFSVVARAFGTTQFASAGRRDAFVASLADLGTTAAFRWAQRAGGTGDDEAYGLSLTGTSVAVSGYVTPPATIGNTSFTGPAGYSAGFLALLPDAAALATTPAASQLAVSVYPNPAHHTATVKLPAGPASLTLFTRLGQAVLSRPVTTSSTELDLAGLVPGLYLLRVTTGQETSTVRLMVE